MNIQKFNTKVSYVPRCWDCKKILWPWQKRGMDNESHLQCYLKRCRDLIRENPDMKDFILIMKFLTNEKSDR